MRKTTFDTTSSPASAASATPADAAALSPADPESARHHEQDPAGGIVLSGRNRMCARTRAMAGMVMTSGLVVALCSVDTTSSMLHHG